MICTFKLDKFEGPLDLLLHLISKNKLEIVDISVSKITTQYIEYIEKAKALNLDMASEFIIMAAELLEIKSKMLLPNPKYDTHEFNELKRDPREDLVHKLLEYKKYKNAADILDSRYKDYGRIVFKKQEDLSPFVREIPVEELNKDLEKDLLVSAMKRILQKIDKTDNNREDFFDKVKRDLFTVEDKILVIREKIKTREQFTFDSLFSKEKIVKSEVIVTFMALLELLKLNAITVVQQYMFDEILIEGRESYE